MERELVCISCALGCRLDVNIENGAVRSVTGNACKRGREYACQEAVRPVRVLTAVMKAQGLQKPFSVRTDKPVPKDMLLACARELQRYHPKPPIAMDDVIIENILGTGSDIVATSDLNG